MAQKKQYYDITNMLSTGAQYMMLLGQRTNGKSYQAKKTVIDKAFNHGEKFVYIRRWDREVKASVAANYFEDCPISELTQGKYDSAYAREGSIYLINSQNENRLEDKFHVGYYISLNRAVTVKSNVFKDVKWGIYEEFITDDAYLYLEPDKLQQLVSTYFRNNDGHVILVGNTISRVCPYFSHWCLEGVLRQKQGTIEVYHHTLADGNVVDIAVENCEMVEKKSNMFFGSVEKQIVSGEWETRDLPHLPRTMLEYDMVYEVEVIYQMFHFCLQLLVEPKEGGTIVYVYPLTKKRKIYRKIQDGFSDLPNISNRLDPRIRPEQAMIDCFRLGKVCYANNLCGADFQHVLQEMPIT